MQKPGCGFPILKFMVLFSLCSGAVLNVMFGNLHDHDHIFCPLLSEWRFPKDSNRIMAPDKVEPTGMLVRGYRLGRIYANLESGSERY